jgi:hypothetical protein
MAKPSSREVVLPQNKNWLEMDVKQETIQPRVAEFSKISQ